MTTLYGTDVFIGMGLIRDLEHKTIKKIINERYENGPFRNMDDFARRVIIERKQLDLLIRIGALRFTGMTKYELMWEKNTVLSMATAEEVSMPYLIEPVHEIFDLPAMPLFQSHHPLLLFQYGHYF